MTVGNSQTETGRDPVTTYRRKGLRTKRMRTAVYCVRSCVNFAQLSGASEDIDKYVFQTIGRRVDVLPDDAEFTKFLQKLRNSGFRCVVIEAIDKAPPPIREFEAPACEGRGQSLQRIREDCGAAVANVPRWSVSPLEIASTCMFPPPTNPAMGLRSNSTPTGWPPASRRLRSIS